MNEANASIIHDAEHYILEAQHGEKWASEDRDVDRILVELQKRFGGPPNIIHIMWDDTPVGEIGIPALQKVRGWETPNLNRLAAEGINFMRMYTEPSCTPSRAAAMTGRHAVRNGMHSVGFPYEYGGLPASEATMGEVLSQADHATAFYGKWHLGDIESSYCTNAGFDEALDVATRVLQMYWVDAQTEGTQSSATCCEGIMKPMLSPQPLRRSTSGTVPAVLLACVAGLVSIGVRRAMEGRD